MNAIGNASNRYQGDFRRALAVCSAGLLRSPTIAHTLCQPPFNYNTRSAGLESSYALNMVSEELLVWAEEIVCADQEHFERVCTLIENNRYMKFRDVAVVCLNLPDIYPYRDPELVRLISERYTSDETWTHARHWREGEWIDKENDTDE